MESHLVSVIIPVYKVEPYLRQCVDSVINQTYKNLEIILVDDGSPDKCPAICDKYASKDSRITVIHQQNQGLSAARNAGIDIARGDYIYFLDSDDYIGKNTINDLYKHFNENKQIAIAIGYFTALIGDTYKTYNESWIFNTPRTIESQDFASRMLIEKSNHAATAKLYRKELFNKIRFQLNKKNEDSLFEADLIPIIEEHQYKCIDVPIYTYFYRLHEKSICHSSEDPFVWHIVDNSEVIINKYKKRSEIVSFLRNRETDLIIEALSCSIKEKNFKAFWEKHTYTKIIPNSFVKRHKNFKVFTYFLILKYAPILLVLREKIIY